MYKTDIVRKVARETRLTQRVVADVVDASHKIISDALRDSQTVTFPGFGTFYTRDRKEGKVRHIKTGEDVIVPAHRAAAFRVGDQLKKAVRRGRATGKASQGKRLQAFGDAFKKVTKRPA